MIEIKLEGLPMLPNKLRTMHWARRARECATWRRAAAYMAKKTLPESFKPYEQCVIFLIRASTSECDMDNGIASFKPLIDGLVDAGVMVDDGPTVVTQIKFGWEPAKRGSGHVRIEVRPVVFEE